eukprot:4520206-Amphidinium_carterae.1
MVRSPSDIPLLTVPGFQTSLPYPYPSPRTETTNPKTVICSWFKQFVASVSQCPSGVSQSCRYNGQLQCAACAPPSLGRQDTSALSKLTQDPSDQYISESQRQS